MHAYTHETDMTMEMTGRQSVVVCVLPTGHCCFLEVIGGQRHLQYRNATLGLVTTQPLNSEWTRKWGYADQQQREEVPILPENNEQ